ncbi:MAG: hypothetical protein KIT84_37195 [Labilithrix sp.]|nr:hypothetical protein [Labilithrix sp.]MCW5816695.1 hypothetical protein [Labilithrix sp.]
MRPSEQRLQPTWLRLVAVTLLGLFITLVVWWPMFKNYPKTPIEDGHAFLFMIEAAKSSVRLYREAPLWNPFDCHGQPLWDHPENITGSPIFLLTLPFSAGVTVIVWSVAHVVTGFVGMWLLCRDDFKLSRAATFVAATAWSFGAVHNQYAGEHMAFFSFYHAPLILFAWRKAETSWDWAVGTGLLLALMVYDGATYPLPLTVVFLGVETLTRLTSVPRALRIAGAAGAVGLVAFTVAASRLLPLQQQFAAHDRVMEDDWDHLARAKTWGDMYLLRTPSWRARVEGQQYVFGEYQAYIGWIGLAVFAIGFACAAGEAWSLTVVMVALVVLMLGHFATWAPWTVLHAHVPPFKSMRVPARFRLLLALPIAAFMAYAVDRFPRAISRLGKPSYARAARVALFGMGVFAAGDSAGLFTQILEFRFLDAAPVAVVPSPRFHYGGPDLSPDYANQPRQNHAWLGCRLTWAYNASAPVWSGDVPQARAKDGGAVVEAVHRTHNTFTLDVEVSRPSRVLLNSGFDLGWRTDVGQVVSTNDNLLALDLPPGHHHVKMKYWPRRFTAGIWLSVVGIALSLAFLLRRDLADLVRKPPAKV